MASGSKVMAASTQALPEGIPAWRGKTRFAVTLALAGLMLSGCENSATSFMVDTNQHALILIREQPYFWSNKVDQFVIASRLPHCQRKVRIHADVSPMTDIEVYVAGDLLWALHQGGRWYLAGTDKCLVQDWDKPADVDLGSRIGVFKGKQGSAVFERES